MAYTIISQNNTTTTLSDENGNVITVPARVTLATSTDYTITKVNNNSVDLESGDGKTIRGVPACVVLAGGGSSDPHNLGFYADLTALQTAHPTGSDGDFAILGSTDTVWVWDSDTSAWKDTDTKGQVTSVNGQTGAVTLTIPDAVQYSVMPTAGADNEGDIVQFTGTTDANYTNGYFYKCVSDGQTPATYSWVQTNVQPAPSGLPDQTGQSGKFLTTDGTDASWSDKPLVNNASIATTVSIKGNSGSDGSVFIGESTGGVACNYSVYIGRGAKPVGGAGHRNVVIGYDAKTTTNAYGSVQLGSGTCGDGQFCVALAPSFGALPTNYKLLDRDGTIPTARLTKVNTTITLTAAGWSSNTQTVNVTGMTATGVVMVSPDPTDQSAYTSAGILATAQAAGTLTFSCDTVPSGDLSVNVVML